MSMLKHFLPSAWQDCDGYGELETRGGEEVVVVDRSDTDSIVVPVREDVVVCDSDRDYNYEPKKKRR